MSDIEKISPGSNLQNEQEPRINLNNNEKKKVEMKIELIPCEETDESRELTEQAFMLSLKEHTLSSMFNFINHPWAIVNKDNLMFYCPYCSETIEIDKNKINYRVFTHLYVNGEQVNPHINHDECLKIMATATTKQANIQGCGKQFQLVLDAKKNIYKTVLYESK